MKKFIASFLTIVTFATSGAYAQNVDQDEKFSPEVQQALCVLSKVQDAVNGGIDKILTGSTLDQALADSKRFLNDYQHPEKALIIDARSGSAWFGFGVGILAVFIGGGIADIHNSLDKTMRSILTAYQSLRLVDGDKLSLSDITSVSAELQAWINKNKENRAKFQETLEGLKNKQEIKFRANLGRETQEAEYSKIMAMYNSNELKEALKNVESNTFFKNAGLRFAQSRILIKIGAIFVMGTILFMTGLTTAKNSIENQTMTNNDIKNMNLNDVGNYFEDGKNDEMLRNIRSFATQIPACAGIAQ